MLTEIAIALWYMDKKTTVMSFPRHTVPTDVRVR